MAKHHFNPDWIPPPGATVHDLLQRKGGSERRASIVTRLGEAQTEHLLDGTLLIDPELASFLAESVGLSAPFWLERERLYREAIRAQKREKRMLEELPLDDMATAGFIETPASHAETMAQVLDFFESEDVEKCEEYLERLPNLVKQKSSLSIVSRAGSLAAWVRAGEIEASRVECDIWNRDNLVRVLPLVRELTRTEDPSKYLPALKSLCQRCGIAFVVLRSFSGCSARGAIKFLSPLKAMMLLSYRHLVDDQFWFSVFHEFGHLLLHEDDGTIVDDWDESTTDKEREADRFAADTLISPADQRQLHTLRDARSIIRFARHVGIARGVVVGQMQHKSIIGFDKFNHLKVRYQWNREGQIERKLV